MYAWLKHILGRSNDLALFHDFVPPPTGGGHQFLRALCAELQRRGLRIAFNEMPLSVRVCLFNSFNCDFDALRRARRPGCRMVHRVDGPIGVYRGSDDGSDARIYAVNREVADTTIMQSQYSLRMHRELGCEYRNPVVIMNAADPATFHAKGRLAFDPHRPIRLIASSWSDNPNKGAAVYEWLDEHLDFERYTFTFVGRVRSSFRHIRVVPPSGSETVAALLREHDIFVTASRNDPCSNSLIEALTCGLPAVYLDSGGHPEIVRGGGLSFAAAEEIPGVLDRLVGEYALFQARVQMPTIAEVTGRYLEVLGLSNGKRLK